MAKLKGTGAEDKKKVAIAAALGLVVLVLAARTLIGGPSVPPPPAPVVAPAATVRTTTTTTSTTGAAKAPAGDLDPTLHPELMAENESLVYAGTGRNIFSTSSAAVEEAKIEKPKGPVRPVAVVASGPPPPAPPPAIDLRFFGFSARKDGMRKAFLLHGDDVFVASEGDVVSHRYKVVKIMPTSVSVEDIPYHNTQSLPLVQN